MKINRLESLTLLFLITLWSLAYSCATTPTGRSQLKLLPDGQMAQMGDQAFTQMVVM